MPNFYKEFYMAQPLGLYAKAVVTAVVAAGAAYANALNDGPGVTLPEGVSIALVFFANLAVVAAIPFSPAWLRTYGKAVFAFIAAVGANLLSVGLLDNDLSQSEVITAIVAGVVATGLLAGFVSNAASSDPIDADGKQVPVTYAQKESIVTPAENDQPGVTGTLPEGWEDDKRDSGQYYGN